MSGYAKDQQPYVYEAAATRPNQAPSYPGTAQPSFAAQYPEASVQLPHEHSGVEMPYIPTSAYESRGETSYSAGASFIDATSRHPAARSEAAPVVTNDINPSHGTAGTTVLLHIRTSYDPVHTTEPTTFALMFGKKRCQTALQKVNEENGRYNYLLSSQVPPFASTDTFDPTMMIRLMVEGKNGEIIELDAGKFTFTDMSPALAYQSAPDPLKKRKYSEDFEENDEYPDAKRQSTAMRQYAKPRSMSAAYSGASLSPLRAQSVLSTSYGYSNSYAPQLPQKSLYAVPGGSSMQQADLRAPQITPGLSSYGQYSAITQRSPGSMATTPVRSSAMHSAATLPNPILVRATTLPQTPAGPSFNPYLMYPSKAVLKIDGDLDSMADNWTPEEVEVKRRLVQFERSQSGSTITTRFAPVTLESRKTGGICVSCIFWEEKSDCFITSVDTIYLLEQLVNVRFTVEEKNRIRRNLEGFRPQTVSKAKADSEEFFKIIMGFPNPRPRNIEKDVKVFPWKILSQALKKIISKYTASYSSTAAAGSLPTTHTPSYLPVGLSQPTGDVRRNTSPRSVASSVHSNAYSSGITSSALSPNMRASAGLEVSAGHGMPLSHRDPSGQGMSQWASTHPQGSQYSANLTTPGRGAWPYPSYLDASPGPAADVPSAAQSMHMQRSNVTSDITNIPPSGAYQQYGQGTSRI